MQSLLMDISTSLLLISWRRWTSLLASAWKFITVLEKALLTRHLVVRPHPHHKQRQNSTCTSPSGYYSSLRVSHSTWNAMRKEAAVCMVDGFTTRACGSCSKGPFRLESIRPLSTTYRKGPRKRKRSCWHLCPVKHTWNPFYFPLGNPACEVQSVPGRLCWCSMSLLSSISRLRAVRLKLLQFTPRSLHHAEVVHKLE